MEIRIDLDVISDAKSRMLTMDEYIYLFYGIQDVEVDLSVSMAKLVRLGYLDKDFDFTEHCLELVPNFEALEVKRFEEFWELYPVSDEVYNFRKTRTLRMNKSATHKEYAKQAKIHGEDLIIEALKKEIEDRMENSLAKNSFSFMKSSLNYLKNQAFMEYA